MHLPDMIEAAKQIRIITGARRVDLAVNDQGFLNAHAWDVRTKNANISALENVGNYFQHRTLDDFYASVEKWVAQREEKVMTNADLGLDENGNFIQQQAAE